MAWSIPPDDVCIYFLIFILNLYIILPEIDVIFQYNFLGFFINSFAVIYN